ncbi:MAG: hypothetical protein AAB214_08180, partial [Fibrobacterota bacterium]
MGAMKLHRVAIASLCLTVSVFASKPPSGSLRSTGTEDMLLMKRKPRWYNEVWSYQFLFDNGTQATLNYTYAKLGFKDPVCGADYSVAGFKGRNFSVGREYPEDRFQQQANPFRVQIHPEMWMQGLPPASHRVRFATTKNEGFYLDLEFSRMIPGAALGNGTWGAGDGEITMLLPIPSARVKGRMAIGKDTIAVEGWAVLEHIRQTALLADILRRSFRAYVPGDRPTYFSAFQEKSGGWSGFAIQWTAQGPQVLPAGQIGVQGAEGLVPPAAISLTTSDKRSLAFRRTSLVQSASILDGMEGVTRWVVKQFVGDVQVSRGRTDQSGFYQYIAVK